MCGFVAHNSTAVFADRWSCNDRLSMRGKNIYINIMISVKLAGICEI